jgi:hypothetical protein
LPARGEQFHYGVTEQQEQSVGQEADAARDFRGQAEAIEAIAGDALEGAANLTEAALDFVADYSERTIDFIAESLTGFLGGASAPPPRRAAQPAADRPSVNPDKEVSRQAEDDRRQRRSQYIRDFDQEISDEIEPEAAIERGRERGR